MPKVVAISDTHMCHEQLVVPRCDLLVHAGDVTRYGSYEELIAFLTWFGAQPARFRVFVAGNHDSCCEPDPQRVRRDAARLGVHYLYEDGCTLAGLQIWGSPIVPELVLVPGAQRSKPCRRDWAFCRARGSEIIRQHWQSVPEGLDVLVTHGPPLGAGDRVLVDSRVGCSELCRAVTRAQPRLHVFGHIHEDAGEHRLEGCSTRFINACSLRLSPSWRTRRPVELEL